MFDFFFKFIVLSSLLSIEMLGAIVAAPKSKAKTTPQAQPIVDVVKWEDYSKLLFSGFVNSEIGGIQKFTADIEKAKNGLTVEQLSNFIWHFETEPLDLPKRFILDNIKKLSITSLLSFMASDLVLLPEEQTSLLAKKLSELKQNTNYTQRSLDSSFGARSVITSCRDFLLATQKSLLFFIDQTDNLTTLMIDKIELMQYFLESKKVPSSDKPETVSTAMDYKSFVLKSRLIPVLWRLQSLCSIINNLNNEKGKDIILETLSNEMLDKLLKNINSGIFSIIPSEKNIISPNKSIIFSNQENESLNFMIKALWAGLKIKDGDASKDPRFTSSNPLYPNIFLTKLKQRTDVADKEQLKNLKTFEQNVQKMSLIMKKFNLLTALPILSVPEIVKIQQIASTPPQQINTQNEDPSSGNESRADSMTEEQTTNPEAPAEAETTVQDMGIDNILTQPTNYTEIPTPNTSEMGAFFGEN